MASLNELAAEITHLLKQPTNYELAVRVKLAYKHWRATLLRQSIERYGVDIMYMQRYVAELIEVDSAATCLVDAGCTILRTKNRIPKPLRYPSDVPFSFVGTLDGEPFTLRDRTENLYAKHLKWSNKVITYDYENDYVYVRGNTRFGYVALKYVAESPEDLINVCDNEDCWDDDMEFPIPEDLIAPIKQILFKEFGVVAPIKEEVVNESPAS